jgi:hypothetical protein
VLMLQIFSVVEIIHCLWNTSSLSSLIRTYLLDCSFPTREMSLNQIEGAPMQELPSHINYFSDTDSSYLISVAGLL